MVGTAKALPSAQPRTPRTSLWFGSPKTITAKPSSVSRFAHCCERVTMGQVVSTTEIFRCSSSRVTASLTPWAVIATGRLSTSSSEAITSMPRSLRSSTTWRLWTVEPRLEIAPSSWLASSIISTARRTPKQNPMSRASRISMLPSIPRSPPFRSRSPQQQRRRLDTELAADRRCGA